MVPASSSISVVRSKRIFKIKHNADGTIQHYKAHLVAQGFTQTLGVDFFETFSPVIKPATTRIILTLAASYQWPVHQLNFNNAFLNGILEEKVYMRQPAGFINSHFSTHVCQLNRAIYGLKQAPRAWFDKLRVTLLSWRFQHSKAYSSLFFLHTHDKVLFILIYVDDVLVTSKKVEFLKSFIANLHKFFSVKDLGFLHYFLGIQIRRSPAGFFLNQEQYITDLLTKLNMNQSSSCPTLIVVGNDLCSTKTDLLVHPSYYRSALGALQYLTSTRPDISFAINRLSQFLHSPRLVH